MDNKKRIPNEIGTEKAFALLKKLYYNLDNPAAFSTVELLFKALKGKIKRKTIQEWLSGQLAHTLHKQRRVNFKHNRYNLTNINDQWQADLMDIPSLKNENDGYRYVLLVIDSFSRLISVRPLRLKSGVEVTSQFKDIIEERKVKPLTLLTDRGKEFWNGPMSSYLKNEGIKHYAPSNDTFKAALAERAIRTFKNIMFRMLTANLSMRYIDNLQKIASVMNSRQNRSIGMAPNDVNEKNIYAVWRFVQDKHQHESRNNKEVKMTVKAGDFIRLAKNKNNLNMDRGYLPNWTDEVFKVVKTTKREQPVYKIKDLTGEDVEGAYQNEEVQRVTHDENTLYRIDEIVKRRKRRGVAEVLVSWKGFPKSHNSWIPASDIVGLE